MNQTIEVTVIRATDGNIDVSETLSTFHKQLSEYASLEAADLQVIEQAVTRVWEENPKLKNLNLDAIASFAMKHIPGVEVSAFTQVQERIKSYVRSATDTYALTKGKGGGVMRRDRLSAEELAKVDVQVAKAAEKAAQKAA